jgi:cardiolipin synthase
MTMSSARIGARRTFNLPNILTFGRVAIVPAVVACLFWPNVFSLRWTALGLFVLAAVTDFFDGYLARAWEQQSSLGRMLDPIADKLLVSAVLMILVADGTIKSWSIWAAIVILCREILVSGLREYLAELRVGVPVTRLAKWKTALQLVAVGFLLAGTAGDLLVAGAINLRFPIVTWIGLTLLWLSALLTLYTGYDYFRAGLHHLTQD